MEVKSPEDEAVARELKAVLQDARRLRSASRTIVAGHPDCPHPVSNKGFLITAKMYVNAMRDLRRRFPDLWEVEPPALSQCDPNHHGRLDAQGPPGTLVQVIAASYDPGLGAIMFADPTVVGGSEDPESFAISKSHYQRNTTGSLAHEYGHHLSSDRVRPKSLWFPKLTGLLKETGVLDEEPIAGPLWADDPRFKRLVGSTVRELGLGTHAGESESEFAAEAIAWRVHPEYGETERVSRMPPKLEAWMHECFDFLDNGQIPPDSVPFDPGSILEPVMVDGEKRLTRRDEMVPPSEHSDSRDDG